MKTKTKKSKNSIKVAIKRVHNSVKLAVVPHKNNGYRPHIVRSYGLVAVFFVVIGLQFGYNIAATGNVLGHGTNVTVSSLLDETNKARTESNLASLSLNNKLTSAAYLKAQDMLDKQYWAHDSPDGVEPWQWFSDVGYNYDQAGENLAKNFASSDAVMVAWLNSPEHKANVLKSEYQDVGFAVVNGNMNNKPVSLVVALYGRTAESIVGSSTSVFAGANAKNVNILGQFSVAAQSITPVTSLGLLIVMVAILSALFAHKHRHKLSKKMRMSWYKHHGLLKAVGLTVFCAITIYIYGGGQI